MLGFIFGFNARIGRVNYLLCSVVVSATSQLGAFLFIRSTIQQMMTGTVPSADALVNWPLYAALGIGLVINFILRSMRIRDIGWDPVLLVPAWIALSVADVVVAAHFPAWAVGQGHYSGTIVGSLIDTALSALLIFMPGAEPGEPAPMDDDPIPDPPARAEPPRHEPPPVAQIAPPTRPEFGRRRPA